MIRSTRTLLLSTAAVAAGLSLALGSAVAEDDGSPAPMASEEPPSEMAPGIHVMDAWARPSPMIDLAGAAYLVIHNATDTDDALVGASSPVAEFVELHLSSMDEEGMMSMSQVPQIAVPAHGEAVLEPGSYHIMLIDLVEPLVLDTEFELSLEFMNAEPWTISVPVQAGMPMGGEMDSMDHDMDEEMGDAGEDAEEAAD